MYFVQRKLGASISLGRRTSVKNYESILSHSPDVYNLFGLTFQISTIWPVSQSTC